MRNKHSTKVLPCATESKKETDSFFLSSFTLTINAISSNKKAMDININGNPGTGNTFTEINIQHADSVNPNATTVTVIHKHYGEGKAAPAAKAPDSEPAIDTAPIRAEILDYVSRLSPLLKQEWKDCYTKLWEGILDLDIVAASIYKPGKQQDTDFNRGLVANIIHYLDRHHLYRNDYNATAIAVALENNGEHTVRNYLGKNPQDQEVISSLDSYMKTFSSAPTD